jgi:hypothetical protein
VEINIVTEVAALRRLSIAQLRQRFAELFGEATNASNRTWLTKRILWRMQALAEADLSQRAAQLACDSMHGSGRFLTRYAPAAPLAESVVFLPGKSGSVSCISSMMCSPRSSGRSQTGRSHSDRSIWMEQNHGQRIRDIKWRDLH